MRLYNTRTRTTEEFKPLRDGVVRIYVCGLTPSAEAHLGHARSFLFFDVLRRYLEARHGYQVVYVQNITDIDDRSIAAALVEGSSWKDVVERHYASFKASMRRLGVREPSCEPRATEYIPQIIEMIERLIEKGHAYAVSDGVYFRVKSFARYGELSGRNVDELLVGARIEAGEEKADPLDFALWKLAKPGEPFWPSPWGAGRPGWHIECSAMTHALLGEPFDIHGGGYDLIFPHHENEIAQSEALLAASPMANFWMHGGLLSFDGRKMSKSLGNFEPLCALLDRHDPRAIRFLFLQTGYRKPMNFSEDSISGATEGLRGLLNTYACLAVAARKEQSAGVGVVLKSHAQRFYAALEDDMNTAGAVGELFKFAQNAAFFIETGLASEAEAFMRQALDMLGISSAHAPQTQATDPSVKLGPDFIERLHARLAECVALNGAAGAEAAIESVISARKAARLAKDFALADRLRGALAEEGVLLTDAKEGTTWSVAG